MVSNPISHTVHKCTPMCIQFTCMYSTVHCLDHILNMYVYAYILCSLFICMCVNCAGCYFGLSGGCF